MAFSYQPTKHLSRPKLIFQKGWGAAYADETDDATICHDGRRRNKEQERHRLPSIKGGTDRPSDLSRHLSDSTHLEMAIHSTIAEAITAYTGLSPAVFFTVAALMVMVYKVVSGMFVDPGQKAAPSVAPTYVQAEPVQIGEVTEEELRGYDGSDSSKPLLMAIKGQIYDVSRSRLGPLYDFYVQLFFDFDVDRWVVMG
ncbi:hypothetical protein MLD38_015896 [Melastoma candidum]|uniref:Uncharacterized protein n=1 Tax=Melastoma candidum TaxID=119954 RepID=A0ACB9RHR4_9MYRT|nr:hypothetical protein MLD38_015896 [Melastoma candidum]